MKHLFRFFVRLLAAFLAAKLLAGITGAQTPAALLGLALVLVVCTYLFTFLERYYQASWRRSLAEFGWQMARMLIRWNAVPRK